MNSTIPRPLLRLETHIVEHCDLNCHMCVHFSPLSKPMFANPDTHNCDMARLSKLFGNDIEYIMLLGGEPLLHPDLASFFTLTRQHFAYANIILYTNGLRLGAMPFSFWRGCAENNIHMTITKYPIAFDYAKIENLLEEHHIYYEYCNTPGRDKQSTHHPLDLSGGQSFYKSFLECDMANRCIFLREGKLYTCPVIPNIQHFNQYFAQSLSVSPQDYIDIYSVDSTAEILQFLATPAPFCRYCDTSKRTCGNSWALSRRRIEEWT